MGQERLSLREIYEAMEFTLLAGEAGLEKEISEEMLSSPGLEFAGFFDYFEPQRIILVGSREATFLMRQPYEIAYERIKYICELNPPAFVFSTNVIVPDFFISLGNEYHIPIFKSTLRTTALNSKLYGYLQEYLANRISVHGVLVDIHGMGTLIVGKSGIGKSETALELIKRGHQLISDDRVDIFEKEVGTLIGAAPKVLAKYMEIRGIGIVNVVQMFGAGAYRENKKIRLVCELEKWEEGRVYDRLGLISNTQKYFNTELVKITIPVLPGRNTATLVESAAMNEKLKYLGYHGASDFTNHINELAKRRKAK